MEMTCVLSLACASPVMKRTSRGKAVDGIAQSYLCGIKATFVYGELLFQEYLVSTH